MKCDAAVGPHRRKQMALTESTEMQRSQILCVVTVADFDFTFFLLKARLGYVLIPSALVWLSVPDCECWQSREHLPLVFLLSPSSRPTGVCFPPVKSHRRVYCCSFQIIDFIKHGGKINPTHSVVSPSFEDDLQCY